MTSIILRLEADGYMITRIIKNTWDGEPMIELGGDASIKIVSDNAWIVRTKKFTYGCICCTYDQITKLLDESIVNLKPANYNH